MTRKFLSLFSGSGGGSLGFHRAGWECVGAFDSMPEACDDHQILTGTRAHQVDLQTITPAELRALCTGRPDAVLTSPPCKGYSGCLPEKMSTTDKYRALNSLAERGIWLVLEAWPDSPPPLILLENVPRINTRGREWLDGVLDLLRVYGYATRETTHDCGELGGLAQHRRRFLLVARHRAQVPDDTPLHVPPVQRVRGIGEVLGELPVPVPGSDAGGPMHALPKLSAMNWVRLALIPAGGDWRDLPESVALPVRSGRQNGGFGVEGWDDPAHAVLAEGAVRNTRASVADPRVICSPRATVYGVAASDEPSGTVLAAARHDNGAFSCADPRVVCKRREGGHGVRGWGQPSHPVIAEATIHNWPAAVADPRLDYDTRRGTMRVEPWAEASHTIIGDCRSHKGANVADPRVPEIDGEPIDIESKTPIHLVIRAADGTWHRPMTTLELAALQGFPTHIGGEWLVLTGRSHAGWRQRIGNAIPPPAAEAIARAMADTLDAAERGGFRLDSRPVWVAPDEATP